MKNDLLKDIYFSRRQLHLLSNLGTAGNSIAEEKSRNLSYFGFLDLSYNTR